MDGLSRLGDGSAGVFNRTGARAALGAGRLDALVRARTLQVVWPGVYADAGYALDAVQRAFAAVLASTGRASGASGPPAYACGRTAARVWGLPLIDDDDPATGAADHLHDDVGVRRSIRDLQHDGRTLHRRQLRLREGELVRLPSGLWATTPLRTLSDCASLLTRHALVCALDAALHRHLVTPNQLRAAVDVTRGGRAAPVLRHAVASADARAESPPESLARVLLLPHLPGLVPQVLLVDAAARPVARFDLADEQLRLAVETDGRLAHAGAHMVARDRRRDHVAEQLGWLTERLSWYDLRRRQRESVRRVLARAMTQARRTA